MAKGIVIGVGLVIIIAGVVIIASSGVDFSNLPSLDFTARIGSAEVTATDITPEAQTTMMSGFLVAGIGIIVMAVGTKID